MCLARARLKRSEDLALPADLELGDNPGKGQTKDPRPGGTTLTLANMG